jgi:kynurenine/2-aminoadipate aminotransferase
LQRTVHKLTRDDVDVAIVPGSQDGLAKLFDALIEPSNCSCATPASCTCGQTRPRTAVIVEAPTYSGSLAYLDGLNVNYVSVPTDNGGMVVSSLADTLNQWDVAKQGAKPKIVYTIPTGSNPTGATMTTARKRELLAVANQHDLLVIEDDPYYYLQYTQAREPTLIELDTHGRVVRTDSFSKILSAGIRIGVVTGPKEIVNRVNLHNQASILHTSGVSQLLVLELFKLWGVGADAGAGLGKMEDHLMRVRDFYSSQCDAFVRSADRHLRSGVDGSGALMVRYTRPSAGMFVWMQVPHVQDTYELIMTEAVKQKVRPVVCVRAYYSEE